MDRQYVGIDFHRRRSVIVRMSSQGERLAVVRIANETALLAAAITEAGPEPEVVIEATYGCQGTSGSAHRRSAVLPAGGQRNCPLMASGTTQ